MTVARSPQLARNVHRLSHLDLPGGGQVVAQGKYAYVGHLDPPNGTSIIDVSDPRAPRVVSQVTLPDSYPHTHKVRVVGDLMCTNDEQYNRSYYRRGGMIPEVTRRLQERLGRAPTHGEIASSLTEDLYVGGEKKIMRNR